MYWFHKLFWVYQQGQLFIRSQSFGEFAGTLYSNKQLTLFINRESFIKFNSIYLRIISMVFTLTDLKQSYFDDIICYKTSRIKSNMFMQPLVCITHVNLQMWWVLRVASLNLGALGTKSVLVMLNSISLPPPPPLSLSTYLYYECLCLRFKF